MENIEIIRFDYRKYDDYEYYIVNIRFRLINNPKVEITQSESFNHFAALDETYSKLLRAIVFCESVNEKYKKNEKCNEIQKKSYILLKQFLIEKNDLSLI